MLGRALGGGFRGFRRARVCSAGGTLFPVMHLDARHDTETNTGGRFFTRNLCVGAEDRVVGNAPVSHCCLETAERRRSCGQFFLKPWFVLSYIFVAAGARSDEYFERFAVWAIDWRVIRSLHFATTLILTVALTRRR